MSLHRDRVRFAPMCCRSFLTAFRRASGLAESARVTNLAPSTAVDHDRFVLSSHHSAAHQPRKDRFPMRRFIATLSRAVAALLLTTGFAAALPYDLSTPAGLNPGDTFRFIVVTSGSTSALSPTISDYDTFVQNDLGGATYGSVLINWKAIGSTASVNARDNVGGFGSTVPVYKPFTGTKVANNLTTGTGGLWSSALISAPDETLTSTIPIPPSSSPVRVYTGSTFDGVKNNYLSEITKGGLGQANAYYGFTASVFNFGGQWISMGPGGDPPSTAYRLYGLSEELTVGAGPSGIPEIDPAGLGSVVALVTGSLGLLERRRRARR